MHLIVSSKAHCVVQKRVDIGTLAITKASPIKALQTLMQVVHLDVELTNWGTRVLNAKKHSLNRRMFPTHTP